MISKKIEDSNKNNVIYYKNQKMYSITCILDLIHFSSCCILTNLFHKLYYPGTLHETVLNILKMRIKIEEE